MLPPKYVSDSAFLVPITLDITRIYYDTIGIAYEYGGVKKQKA
jgi:hypothetical protein